MLLPFFSYNPVILYITWIVEILKICSVYLKLFQLLFHFSRSRKRNIPVSKRIGVSRPSIYMN